MRRLTTAAQAASLPHICRRTAKSRVCLSSRDYSTVNVAVSATAPAVAVIVTVCVVATFDVMIVKFAVVLP